MADNWQEVIANSLRESIATKQGVLANWEQVARCGQLLIDCLLGGGTIFFIGNGGSAADAQHLAAELVGRFERDNHLPALALTTDTSCLTAIANDFSYQEVFVRQVRALMRPGDLLVAISTSGNSLGSNLAAQAARDKGCAVVGLSGRDGGQLKSYCREMVVVPSQRTCRIQESHITIGHIWCEMIERACPAPNN